VPPLAAVPDLEHELDALYALPLEEFTKARNDLASRLRKAHQGEAADEVRALRKPSVAAWAANRLAREHPDLVGALVDAGTRLRQVQQGALAGKDARNDVADASARERDAVRALLTAAREELGPRGTPQLLDRLGQTLRAAAVDSDLARTLTSGRLTEEAQAVGFGPLEAVPPARRPRAAADRKAARDRLQALRADAKRLAAEARDAEQAAALAERDAARLRATATESRRRADDAAAAVADAESSPA
jgi:hypothetical protein